MWYFPNRASALFNPLAKLRHWPDTSCKLSFVFMTEFTVSHIINTDTVKILEVMMIFLMTLKYPRPFNFVEKGNNFLPYHHVNPAWTSLWIRQRLSFRAIAQSVRHQILNFYLKTRGRWLESLSFILLPGLFFLQIKFFINFDQYKFHSCLDVFQCHWTQKSHYTEKVLLRSSLEIC